MSALLWQGSFALLAGGLASLPLWPALREWRHPSETAPEPADHAVGMNWLASVERFQASLQTDFASLLALVRDDEAIRGSSSRGVPFLVLGQKKHLVEQLPASARVLRQWVISARHLDIPGELVCERPLHAESRLNIAHNAIVRSAHARRELVVGARARVRQWAYCSGRLDAAEGAQLLGLAAAGRALTLARQVRFTRLIAPCIHFGRAAPGSLTETPRTQALAPPSHVREHVHESGQTWHVRGDLMVPAGFRVDADVIASGRIVLGRGSRVRGSLHARGMVHLDAGARVDGTLYGDSDIHLGEDCRVAGSLQSTGRLTLDAGCEIGSAQQSSTVTAHTLRCAESSRVFGAVHARHGGEVVAGARA